jgi:Protein of unknown function, DUF481
MGLTVKRLPGISVHFSKFFSYAVFTLAFCMTQVALAQKDSLIMKNGDVIVGEIKDLDKGVAIIETPYSDTDFKIEWKGLKEIYTTSYFLITLSTGSRYNGKISSSENGKVRIVTHEKDSVEYNLIDIVYLKSVKPGFWQKFKASIDFDLSRAKANDLSQVSVNSMVGYLSERWSADATYYTLFSAQDSVESIKRTEGGINYRYYLPKDWFLIASISLLSNSEQKLDLRLSEKGGLGKYLIHSNDTYWSFMGGLAYNYEEYSTETSVRKSWEGFLGSELNMYDIGDLNLLTKLIVSPSLTESGRWRADFNFNAKYDLPLEFYVRLGYTLNFDNQPVEGGSRTDYIVNGGFGWEW